MVTSAAPPARPGGTVRRVLLPLVLAVLVTALVLATVAVRADRPVPTASDLHRVHEATELGCVQPASVLDGSTGFALDGTVESVRTPRAGRGPALVRLLVSEWFVGPPIDRVEVYLDAATLRHLRTVDDVAVEPGTRLLVSGRGWGSGQDAPAAAGCGRTRAWDAATATDWRSALPPPSPVGPDGPVARYPDAGFVRTGSDGSPTLVGVAVLDRGCVYVHDGLTRWVPVFPSGGAGWSASQARLLLGSAGVDAGHPVRLAGTPATGVRRSGAGPQPVPGGSTTVDEQGVPDRCDDHAPRFVVGWQAGPGTVQARRAPAGDALVTAVTVAARRAGLPAEQVRGEVHRDAFGGHSARLSLRSQGAGEVLVHVETVPFLAWPHAYVPSDAGFAWSLDPQHAHHVPVPPAGGQLAVLDRADGSTQLLLRTAERVVVSVTADLGPVSGEERERGLESLAALAGSAALSRGGAGS